MRFRLLISSIFSLFIFISGVKAQDVVIMPSIGINYSMMSEDFSEYNFDGRTGWQAGVEIKFGQKFYVSPGVFFVDSKSKIDEVGEINVEPIELTLDFQSIMIPLMIGGDLFASEDFGLRAEAGPSLSFFLDESEEMITNDILIEDYAWGAQVGLAADISFLTLGIRQQIGLTNIFNFENAADARLSSFQFYLGVRL